MTFKIDKGKPVDIIYLDFAKAFDKVPYQRLFKKLVSQVWEETFWSGLRIG